MPAESPDPAPDADGRARPDRSSQAAVLVLGTVLATASSFIVPLLVEPEVFEFTSLAPLE